MNKGDLISTVATTFGINVKDAKTQVEGFADIFKSALLQGNEVTIPGVGKLKVSVRPARTGRNPATGAVINIPEKRVVKFTASSSFKTEISDVPASS